MSGWSLGFIVCLYVSFSCSDADPVSFITKCKETDLKCLKKSTQAAIPTYTVGVPELKVEPLDPLYIDKLDASAAGLNLVISDITLTGLKGCRVLDMERDVEKNKLVAHAQCDIDFEGHYDMSGTLLILPLTGNGKVQVKLRKINLNVIADMVDKTGKDGKTHWSIKSWSHTFELKDKADVYFDNLLPGNQELGDQARKFIKESGNVIIEEVGAPVIKAVVSKLLKNVQKFFRTVPLEDLVIIE